MVRQEFTTDRRVGRLKVSLKWNKVSFENLPHNKKSFKLLMKHEFKTVLDIGSGKGNLFTQILIDNNKKVDSVDFFDEGHIST